jgi:hypothetical protein
MDKNPKTALRHLTPLLIFFLLTLILTYPAVWKGCHSIIGDYGDSLFNTWILAWDVHKIVSGEWFSLFDANIFYPHKNTLAYSEHMLGNALIALPVLVTTGNPVLAYNLTFLACLFLSAWGMYLLVFYLTQNRLAALISGIIFGFFPWRFAHLSHVQLQATQWLPFTFLYLHRFLNKETYGHLLLFTLFFVLQFLSCGYYGLYLALFVVVLILLTLGINKASTLSGILKLGFSAVLAALFILPVYYPYLKVKKEMGFSRSLNESIHFSADLLSYLNTTDINHLWGKITQAFWKPEGELFLGVMAISLGIIGIFISLGKQNTYPQRKSRNPDSKNWLTRLRCLLLWLLALDLLIIGYILFFGGISTTLFGIRISAQGLRRPVWIFFIGTVFWSILTLRTHGRILPFGLTFLSPHSRFYFWMLVLSVLFSFGPVIHINGHQVISGPYVLLYKFIPGFDGLRVPARFIVMVALGLSVFAGFGMKRILVRLSVSWGKILLTAGIALLILAEYASFPISMLPIEVGEKIPPVYQWLAKQKGEIVVLELPLPDKPGDVWKEAERVYFSSYHWKKLVNGYSGYFPPSYDYLYQTGLKGFPSEATLALIKKLNLTYLIIHYDSYDSRDRIRILSALQNYSAVLKPVGQFGKALVYELSP